MRIIEVLNARKIISEYEQEKLQIALAYKIMKFLKATEDDSSFYKEKFSEMVQKYGEKSSGGFVVENGHLKLRSDNKEEGIKAFRELDSHEVAFPNIKKFTLTELSELKLSAKDLFTLEEFIEEE